MSENFINEDESEDVPKNLSEIEINVTCMYGSLLENSKYESAKKNAKDKILNYSLSKILCQITQNHIVGLKFFYTDRTDGSVSTFVNIEPPKDKGDLIEQEMELSSFENVIDARVWLKDVKLTGFEITTSKGNIQKFGYGSDQELILIHDFENHDQAVVSFGAYYDDKEGVTGIEMDYLDKRKYYISLYSGVFYLRLKMKKEDYRKNMDIKIKDKPEHLQVLYRTCSLPDNSFFGVMKYALS